MRFIFTFLLCSFVWSAGASERIAHYLANEGVMVQRADIKIVFDPLFDNDYGQYETLPPPLRLALLAGEAPYDDLTAAFISHSHEDHFSPMDMILLMDRHPNMRLFAPKQALEDLTSHETFDQRLLDQIVAIEPSSEIQAFQMPGLAIEAVSIPHSGWPNRMTEIHNLIYRVTLTDTTIIHLGDADPKVEHFLKSAEHWRGKSLHMAFPPYWFLYSDTGRQVLAQQLKPGQVVGIHVPKAVPDREKDRPIEYQGPDLFTVPGETREIRVGTP